MKRPERQWPLPLARQRPQTFPMGRAESEDAAYSADILRKLRMTSLPATSSDTVNNGSRASGKSGKHQPSAPSAHYTSEKVAPTSLGMSLFLDAPLPPGTDRCFLSS